MITNKTMMKTLVLGLVLGAAGVASADKRVGGDTHTPPLYTDETSVGFSTYSKDSGVFGMHSSFLVYGTGKDEDGIRLEWKQGGKVVGTIKCRPNANLSKGTVGVDCGDDAVKFTAAGTLEANLVYVEEATSKEYLIRSFKVPVVGWTAQGKYKKMQVLPDDTMGIGYALTVKGAKFATFFTTTVEFRGSSTLRCKVDGKQLDDVRFDHGGASGGDDDVEVDVLKDGGPRLTYHYYRRGYESQELFVGKRKAKDDGAKYLGDNPGQWGCDFRVEGKVVRHFDFTVDADGLIPKSSLETAAKNPIKLPDGMVVVAMTIPKGIEEHFRPAAVKASYNWGAPWPDAPDVKKWLAALPPSVGPDVK